MANPKLATDCPECGVDLSTKDRAVHAQGHWGENVRLPHKLPPEARTRLNAILGRA